MTGRFFVARAACESTLRTGIVQEKKKCLIAEVIEDEERQSARLKVKKD